MGRPDNWQVRFDQELALAEAARARGNEGMARVCARRAAGIAAGEFFRRAGRDTPGTGAYDCLRYLLESPGVPAQARDAIERLLMRVTVDHDLPEQIDLVDEALRLREELLGD